MDMKRQRWPREWPGVEFLGMVGEIWEVDAFGVYVVSPSIGFRTVLSYTQFDGERPNARPLTTFARELLRAGRSGL